MSEIKITDSLNATLAVAKPTVGSAFNKYLNGAPANLLAGAQAATALRLPLAAAAGQKLNFGLGFTSEFGLNSTEAELQVDAGAEAAVAVQAGKTLFAGDLFGEAIKMPAGRCYVSFGFAPRLALDLSQPFGDLTFGVGVGASLNTTCYRLFDQNANLTLADATAQLLSGYTLPADLRDLQSMAVGDVATVTGSGTLRVQASLDLAAAVNPLATASLPLGIGGLKLKAGASVAVAASIEVRGEYQLRVHRVSATKIRLGCYRLTGRAWEVSVEASFGARATLGKRDLITTFLKKFMRSEEDVQRLVDSGLTEQQIERILSTAEKSMSRSVALSLQAGFSGVKENEAAFLYELDITRLLAAPAAVQHAVHAALNADFTGLTALESELPTGGVTLVSSAIRTVRERKTQWRINLLGLYNIISVSKLLVEGEVLWEPHSGELIISEKASVERIRILGKPGEADGDKLRRVVFESLLLTATYRAAQFSTDLDLAASQSYFEFHSSTNRETMLDHLDALVAIDLMTAGERSALPNETHFGASTLLLNTSFNQKACETMFLTPKGKPRPASDYEAIGRRVMAALFRPGEEVPRRTPMVQDQLWKDMTATGGSGTFDGVIKRFNPSLVPHTGALRSDMLVILWWASAMAKAAERIVEMRDFLKGKDPVVVKEDHEFKKRKDKLEKAMASSVAQNKAQFGDPWGLLALAAAGGKEVEKRAVVASPKFSVIRPA